MSKNIYKERLFSSNFGTPGETFTRVIVELEQVKIDASIRFVLSADVTYFYDVRDDEGKTVFDLELLLEKYKTRELALRQAITLADDLKKRYEDYTEATE